MVKFIESEQNQLKEMVLAMFNLVSNQIEKAGAALLVTDKGLAAQILVFEHKVNSSELHIKKTIEDFLALYNPVAIDLRFILAVLQISSDLERIGDYAEGIARFVKEMDETLVDRELLKDTRIEEMVRQVLSMLQMAERALCEEHVQLANAIFAQDVFVNEIRERSMDIIALATINNENIDTARYLLHVQDVVRKLERAGDHIKNIAEEIIFYIDAKVVKHGGKTVE